MLNQYSYKALYILVSLKLLAVLTWKIIARQLFGKPLDHTRLDKLRLHRGIWHSIDDNLLRIKIYENGNCHILFNQCVVDRINQVLNLLYPNQIGIDPNVKHKRRAYDEPIL